MVLKLRISLKLVISSLAQVITILLGTIMNVARRSSRALALSDMGGVASKSPSMRSASRAMCKSVLLVLPSPQPSALIPPRRE